jgi:lysophospholipase L1-like esterase
MPTGKLYPRLVNAGKALGRFRAVLWQQGESDVIARTTTAKYVSNLKTIRAAAVKAWGAEVPWLLAKSTHHPTVYNDPEGEGRIRRAVDELTKLPGFVPGPDTDTLTGENRGGPKSRRHFSAVGQRRAAELWFAVLKRQVNSRLPELKLLAPAWSSAVVQRESSVLLQMRPGGPATARLAFPAAEVLEVSTAGRTHRFDLGSDLKLSDDGLVVTFLKPGPVEPIKASDLFPPKDSPNSYRHRTGHPDQNLLYRPGRWFHDRNVEITYRRREVPAAPTLHAGTLPKALARLKAGKALTLGISGDSISTGLDASALTKAAPNQPGYPDLVAAQLRETFGRDVALKNRAVAGWSVAHGVKDLDKLLAEKPNLIVVAYGMNDVGRRDPKWFGKQTREILDRVRKADPDAEVILVSPMLGNAEWVHTPREMFAKYRDEMKALAGPGVALADVTAVWELMLRHKHDLDLTGNGLNHPNDFGHRLYAQAILSLLAGPRGER